VNASSSLVIRGGTVLVGDGLEPIQTDIEVEAGKIVGLPGSSHSKGEVVEAEGRFVIPGLIDAHVHFGINGSVNAYEFWQCPPLLRSLAMYRNGIIALLNGVTTVRDLGAADHSVIEYSRLVASRRLIGPTVVACGQFIVMTGGHGWEWGRQADGPDDVRRAVREQIRAGAGVVKFMATGGLSTPGSAYSPELTPEELKAGVEEAHKAGLKAAAHAHNSAGIAAALSAGVDSIEHAALASGEDFDLIRAAGVTLVPTLVAVSHIRPGSGVDPEVIAKTEAAREVFHESIRTAIAHDVSVVAGTDAGTSLNPIGRVVDEIVAYVELGMSIRDALLAATVHSGRLLGRRAGSLEPGAVADILIVDANPLDDLETLRTPRSVIAGGSEVPIAELQTTLAGLPAFGPVFGPTKIRDGITV
jgi:imidazolonepropionase-like amidohydrolase